MLLVMSRISDSVRVSYWDPYQYMREGPGSGIRIRFFFSLGNGLEKILILRGWTLSISDRIRNPCHERKKPQINYYFP